MYLIMKTSIYFLMVLFLGGAGAAQAYELTLTEIEKPYQIVPLEYGLGTKQLFLGELNNFPVMYEVGVDSENTFKVFIRQRYFSMGFPTDFSLIVIRENDAGRGVTEIARLKPKPEDWKIVEDKKVGMTFWESEMLDKTIQPGLYRIEISTADNSGRFLLGFGETDSEAGYLKELGNVYKTQSFFGFSFLKLLTSSLVYYPLGIIFLVFVFHRTWKYRNVIKHAN